MHTMHHYCPTCGSVLTTAATISPRGMEVLQLVGQGLPIRTIADRLHISRKTVESHCARLRKVLYAPSMPCLYIAAHVWLEKHPEQKRT